jgi:hypothetical protein
MVNHFNFMGASPVTLCSVRPGLIEWLCNEQGHSCRCHNNRRGCRLINVV